MKKTTFFIVLVTLLMSSCVTMKQHEALRQEIETCNSDLTRCAMEADQLRADKRVLETKLSSMDENIGHLKKSLELCSDMNQQGSMNIGKLLDEINSSNVYIRQLIANNAKKDSLNQVLSNNLKRSLGDINSDDLEINVKKGVVFISLSDKMLFQSGKYQLNSGAETVLAKIAKIVNDYKNYDILIEGHTDNVPISTKLLKDNWDLSAMRATAIARYLQTDLRVDPSRITAGARSEYVPKASNETAAGRAVNRRTEIIILPKLDEFVKLMEGKE